MGEAFRTAIEIAAPPERVYPYFTDPDAILRWMGDYADLDPRPGGHFVLDINGVPVRGRYLELDPPYRLVISWGHAGSDVLPAGSSTLTVTLRATATGTLVDIEHGGLPPEQASPHATGWAHFLGRLAIAAPGGDPGPDPFADPAVPR